MTEADAVAATGRVLREMFGADLRDTEVGEIVVPAGTVTEYEQAWLVPFNTRAYVEDGDITAALVPSVVAVPNDGSPAHVPPSAIPVEEYFSDVASGRRGWLSAGG